MLNEGVAAFGTGPVKENWEHLRPTGPSFYSAAAWTTLVLCYLHSTVLLFSFLPSVQNLHCIRIIFFTGKSEAELIWIISLCACWQIVQPSRNGSVEQNGAEDLAFTLYASLGGYFGLAVNCSWSALWECSSLPSNVIRKVPILHIALQCDHSTVSGADLEKKRCPPVN